MVTTTETRTFSVVVEPDDTGFRWSVSDATGKQVAHSFTITRLGARFAARLAVRHLTRGGERWTVTMTREQA